MKYILISLSILAFSCNRNGTGYDAQGTFEAREVIVSAEATGQILAHHAGEGRYMKAGDIALVIDSTQLYLKKQQLDAQVRAVLSRTPDKGIQLAGLQEQLKTTRFEEERLANLVRGNAATQKQLDDIRAQIKVLEKQLDAQRNTLETTISGIHAEVVPLSISIDQMNEQLNKCRVVNPVQGTVMESYTEPGELAVSGKPLYRIADLSTMILRAYITGNQLSEIKPGMEVTVLTDEGTVGYRNHKGRITWISEEAEFTPKTIQTRDERANLVYAIKIEVRNDGSIKSGMYGEVDW